MEVADASQFIKTIEWDMMNKSMFFPLSMLSSFTIRCCFYPLTLIKTQLQIQLKNNVYSGMFDAGFKIYHAEGLIGLYRGFWVSSMQIFSGVFYISTYEGVRHLLTQYGARQETKSLVAGGCASLVGQSIIVPFDVISQHAMVLGMGAQGKGAVNPLGIKHNTATGNNKIVRFHVTIAIAKEIMRRDGFKGYYRGYNASLMAYVPNSALWWMFYHLYEDKLITIAPATVSHLLIQAIAGSVGGFTTTIITNPLDIVRARLQVQRLDSMRLAFTELWAEEKFRMFTKGLSARIVQSAVFSFSIILGYETIKRLSINEQYRHMVKW